MESENNYGRDPLKEFIFELFACIYIAAVVVLFWNKPFAATLLLAAGAAGQFAFFRTRADLAMMVAAALIGTPAEMLCVKEGVWTYIAPGLVLGVPVWLPLVWANLFGLFRRISFSIMKVLPQGSPGDTKIAAKIFFICLSLVIIIYYVISMFLIRKSIAIIFSVFMVPAVFFWHEKRDILIFVIGGILGTLGEYMCMKLGFWHYHYPYFKSIGLPVSLPLAWGLSAVTIGRIARNWESSKQ